jgi:hypothetical protein
MPSVFLACFTTPYLRMRSKRNLNISRGILITFPFFLENATEIRFFSYHAGFFLKERHA